jgi:uncharacterized UBP type Zn finger protein
MGREHQEKINYLLGMGFTKDQAQNALEIFQNNLESSLEYLL